MSGRLKAHLQLVRLPNVLTAAADSLAGWLLAGGALTEPARWGPLAGASMVLYASGMALNDVFDIEVDRVERPGRPLPSGRVSTRVAAWLGGLGLFIGPALAWAGGSNRAAVVAVVLAGCILTYNAGVKHTPLGPVFMGACRSLNLLMGLALAPDLAGPIGWWAAGLYGLFVAGITVVSRWEIREGESQGVLAGVIIEDLALLGLAVVSLLPWFLPTPTRSSIPFAGLLVFLLVAWVVNRAATTAILRPEPRWIQRAVKTGILSLVWLNVGLVAGVRGIGPAVAVAALWVPAYLLGRWLYST
jgi:4-hydroxybenzoate polyprenyltransferase